MSLSRWDEGSDSDRVTGLNRDNWLAGHRKIPALQSAKLPRSGREGAVQVRQFTAETRLLVSIAQGLSGETMKGNPTTTVIPGVDESNTTPEEYQNPQLHLIPLTGPRFLAYSFEYLLLTRYCESDMFLEYRQSSASKVHLITVFSCSVCFSSAGISQDRVSRTTNTRCESLNSK